MTLQLPGITDDPLLEQLADRLCTRPPVLIQVTGVWGSSAGMVIAHASRNLKSPLLVVTPHLESADAMLGDISLFSEHLPLLFPAWEGRPGEGAGSGEIEAERLRVLSILTRPPAARPSGGFTIVAPILALMQPVPPPSQFHDQMLSLTVGRNMDPAFIISWAEAHGYESLDLVESPGEISRRGDILDVFPPGDTRAIRVHFINGHIESIHHFDPTSQRSEISIRTYDLTAARARLNPQKQGWATLTDYLPDDTAIVLDHPSEIQEMGQTYHRRLSDGAASYDAFEPTELLGRFTMFRQVHLTRFGIAGWLSEDAIHVDARPITRFEGKADEIVADLVRRAESHPVTVVCDNDGERERLSEMLRGQESAAAEAVRLDKGHLHRGFEWARTGALVIPHHELFSRHIPRRRLRRAGTARAIDSWVELRPGDMVVHSAHGLALYRGIEKMRKGGGDKVEEFLTLEFAEGATLYVPASQIDLVQKYVGAGGRRPSLSVLGGKRWKKTKEHVAQAVEELAESLLRMQAIRSEVEGTAYPGDTPWQREFENAFPYEETEDQIVVADEIKRDLGRPRPMDRLICGDVGYGKTELAMRAAFKVVEYGCQVAVLVPTTILAEQHYETFRERFADYPFVVGCLSRFRSAAEQRALIESARKGRIDILIGTHRLLSRDVDFANLGLVIIDEEQRFGVEHKERLKQLRETVDVITLSATPIPRTLHMVMTGLRDISTLQTPPIDRRSIATQVLPFNRELIREAILREMNRDGQTFFVHNIVQSIHEVASGIHALVPEARVLVGHGQMDEDQLEEVMFRFAHREADVLVCTTIIENGIDIPSANTIFIDKAERFGLADLHQLRGRVGRSTHRGYCYLLVSPDRRLTPQATRRLKTIEEFSELGAGFRIAMRDLEIRGAGNLLGPEQSGHIAAVGYDLYCRMLEQTVRRLKNEPDTLPPPVHLELDVAALIPDSYIASERSRIEIYRRLAGCARLADIEQLTADLQDVFGPPPREVGRLIELAELRVRSGEFGVRSIVLRPPDVVFTVDRMSAAQAIFEDAPGTVRMPDAATVHLRLPARYLEPDTLLSVLRKMMVKAGERRGVVRQ